MEGVLQVEKFGSSFSQSKVSTIQTGVLPLDRAAARGRRARPGCTDHMTRSRHSVCRANTARGAMLMHEYGAVPSEPRGRPGVRVHKPSRMGSKAWKETTLKVMKMQ